MSVQSPKSPTRDSFGTPIWKSREKEPFGCTLRGVTQGEPLMGREETTPSIIRKIEKVQGGEHAPRNGSLALPKDAAVKPFSLEGKLNAILIVLTPILARRSNGLPGGHAHLRRSFPRLEHNPFEGVLAIKVPSASFGPEIIEQKAPKNVEGLSLVGEATRVVAMEVRGVVLFFEHGLPKKNEGPGNGEAVGRLPFAPDTQESTPGLLGQGAFHETVSGRFLEPLVTAFAGGLNSHGLEPGAHRQPVVECQPGERSNLAGTRIVPHSGNDLGNCRVVQTQVLDEGDDAGGMMFFPCIMVPSLGGVSKEGSVAHVARRLPMPVPRIPREIRDESRLKNPIDWRFFTWLEQILGELERGSMAVLGEDSNRLVPLKGNDGAV